MKNFLAIKKEMEKGENKLSNLACKSSDSIKFFECKEDIRTEFERDIDRIIHTLSYTRYLDKTQVYINSQNDNISTRMTHVQFVARAARTIARALNLNEDLCEAIALGHDVGHTPFGHTGEATLSDISKKHLNRGFAHNLNSVRVFMEIEKHGLGCNLSIQVLDGIMCHNGEMVKSMYAPVKKDKETFLKEYSECVRNVEKVSKLVPMTMEGCVVRISDIIGYIGKDIDDACRLNLLNPNQIPKSIEEKLGITNDKIMNTIILDIIEQSYNKEYIQMSSEIYEQVVKLKEFNYNNIYIQATSKEKYRECVEMINKLFDVYIKALKQEDKANDIYTVFLEGMCENYVTNTPLAQIVIDYMAGMTDNFIERQYKKYILK